MGLLAKGKYRVIRSSEIGKETLKEIVAILKIPELDPKAIRDMTIDISLKDPEEQ